MAEIILLFIFLSMAYVWYVVIDTIFEMRKYFKQKNK